MARKQPPQIQKGDFEKAVNGESLVSKQEEKFLKSLTGSSVACIDCGMGQTAEWLSQVDNVVYAVEEDRLFFSFRKAIVPNSRVICVNDNPSKWMKSNVVDHIVLQNEKYLTESLDCASKSVFVMDTLNEHVANSKKPVTVPKNPSNKGAGKKEQSDDILPVVEQTGDGD